MKGRPTVAYFSMEVAHANEMPNYAGGLGVLAADTILSAADVGLEMVGVSLLYHQNDDLEYGFNGARYMTLRPETVEVEIEDRKVKVAIWEKEFIGLGGHVVPTIFLSTHVRENALWDRDITLHLYAPDRYTRFCQEVVLGVGGVRALQRLGYTNVDTYQLNEGHAALSTLELLKRYKYDEARVRSLVTFTTHTPIEAGHDYFDYDLVYRVAGGIMPMNIKQLAGENALGMTQLAMALSKSTNSVSKRHQKVCATMYPGKIIQNVTNGIYAPRWAGDHMRELFDTYVPGWAEHPVQLDDAVRRIPSADLQRSRQKEKEDFVNWVNFNKVFFRVNNVSKEDLLDEDTLTIGFARRAVPYKRPDLVFREFDRLARFGDKKLQIIFANRCHPDDRYCNELRGRLNDYAERLRERVRIILIPDYDLKIAKKLVSGCDVWLNTPTPPLEASGTSGMKAALNGGLNLSMHDGWWIEGFTRAPMSGWQFGGAVHGNQDEQDTEDAKALMDALEDVVACYYTRKDEWTERMKHAISLIGHFNTSRVLEEYARNIWGRGSSL